MLQKYIRKGRPRYLLLFLVLVFPFLFGIAYLIGLDDKAFADVQLDAQVNASGSTSWKHKIGNNANMLLLVGTSGDTTAVTYGNTPLTLLQSHTTTATSSAKISLWYLLQPPVGNADVQITGGTGNGSVSYFDVNLESPFGATNTFEGNNALTGVANYSVSGSVTSSPEQMIFGYIDITTQLGTPPGIVEPASGQATVWATTGSRYNGASSITASSGNATSMGWNLTTLDGTYDSIGILVGINPRPIRYTITGNVFIDTNRNGVKESGESEYAGATVALSNGATTTTDAGGNASFPDLEPGTYTATMTLPANHRSTTATSYEVTVGPNRTVSFGITPIYTITGNVFTDLNTNGNRDGSDGNYQNATVVLSGAASATTTTDANGNYTFPNIYGGDYTIALRMPNNYRSTTANSLNLTLNTNRTINFGIVESNIVLVGGVCTGGSIDIIVVFDRSNSMSGTDANGNQKFSQAKIAAHSFIDTVLAQLPTARIGIVQMAGSLNYPHPNGTSLVTSLTSNSTQLHNGIDSISMTPDDSPYDQTCFECSLHASNSHLRSNTANDRQKMVIFMTDGIANGMLGGTTSDVPANQAENAAMQEVINGVNQQNIVFNTVGVGSGGGNLGINVPFLEQLADTNNGVSFINPTHGNLVSIYRRIIDQTVGTGTVTGRVFNDVNRNGTIDSDESGLANWTIELSGGNLSTPKITTSDSNGNYSITGLCTNTYTVNQVLQPGWQATTATSYTLDVETGTTISNINFGNRNFYTISGRVFADWNKNGIQDPDEPNYNGRPTISASRGTVTTFDDGRYVISDLLAGTVTVSYTSLPPGYYLTYPLVGPPPSFQVTVGPSCNTNGAIGAICE